MTPRIYFDNAATTSIHPEVLDAMMPYLTTQFGNPSSIYSYGRETRLAVENARKTVARILNAHPAEIFFTSGGTESSNTAICAAAGDLRCTRIITSLIEHHATLHTVRHIEKQKKATVEYVNLAENGHIDLNHLEHLLSSSDNKTLVTLMHANNEIGNITNINSVGEICKKYGAVFHSDTVQTVGHFPFDLKRTSVDFINGAAHKFHGPKGIGILYVNEHTKIQPFIQGGAQERNMRAGTENIYGIVGFAKALQLAADNYEKDSAYIKSLKQYMMRQLVNNINDVGFNGDAEGCSLYTVLNVSLPKTNKSEMILFNLDIHHICASGGSACSSGADAGSHVISALQSGNNKTNVRFSFSKYNTCEEIDCVITTLKELI